MITLIEAIFTLIQDTIEEIPFTEYEELESKPLEYLKR